jgi:Tfp pilus assembly protein PilX
MRRLRLRNEEGMVLPIALGVLAVLTISVMVVIDSSASNSRSSTLSKGEKMAFALAEAGINNTLAVLNLPTNNALKQVTLPACTGDPETTWRRNEYEGGYVLWCGTLNLASALWDVKATGVVRNPYGTKTTTRTLGARITVTPTLTQPLNNPAWNYLFNRSTAATCDMTLSNNLAGSSRLYIAGDLCLSQNAVFNSAELIVHGSLSLEQNAAVGASTNMNTRVQTSVGNGCRYAKYNANAWALPCSGNQDVRNIFSKTDTTTIGVSSSPPVIAEPVSDFANWYANSIPGPSVACTTSSGTVPTWDNDTTRNNSVTTVFELTPATSYTCRAGPADTPVGELSWNATTKTLTVYGTMFIDGSVKITNGFTNQYNGQATLYLGGTFLMNNNSKLCGSIVSGNCDFSTWNPNTEMLMIVADGSGGQAGTGNSIWLDNNAQIQAGLFATYNILMGNNSRSDGPMVANQLVFANNVQNDSFPTITTVPVGMPGNPSVYAQPNPPQMFSG